MALLSLFQGYYVLNTYKEFGLTIEVLNDDRYLSIVGSASSLFNALRFLWSGSLDLPGSSFRVTYTVMLTIQIVMGMTMSFACQYRSLYPIWIAMMFFTEGGHFTIFPNVVRIVYGSRATEVYGSIFTFCGVTGLIMIFLVSSPFGQNYLLVYKLSTFFCLLSLLLVHTIFDETPLKKRKKLTSTNETPLLKLSSSGVSSGYREEKTLVN